MKTLSLIALASLPFSALAAQNADVPLKAQFQVFGEVIRPYSIIVPVVGTDAIKDQPDYQTGLGLRLLGELPELRNVYYEFAGKIPSHSKLSTHTTVSGNDLDLGGVRISHSYFSFGGAYILPLGDALQVGAHLEGRYERLRLDGSYSYAGASTPVDVFQTYVRPWVRLSANATLGTGAYRPLVGVDVAAALTRTKQANISPGLWDDNTARSMAPRWSASVFAGLQF